MVNEADIEDWLVGRGFQTVLPHGMTILEQAQLFAQAEVVVAPNGAGLANQVFFPTDAKVFELLSPTWLGTYSWEVSNLRRLDYYYLIGEPARPHPDPNAYRIALTDLSRLMADAGL
jgi:capsular polysaccharide biosynthesis protein